MSRTKFFTALVAILSLLAGSGLPLFASNDPDLDHLNGDIVARWHFIGVTRILNMPGTATLSQMAALKESTGLRDRIFDKIAVAPFHLFQHKLFGRNTNDFKILLRPLIDDLMANESYAEMRGPNDAVPEFLLAVRLDNNRAAMWQTNLATVLTAWTGIAVAPVQGDGFNGWELKKHHDPNVIRCLRAGDWLLFGWGWEQIKLQPDFLNHIHARQEPVAVGGSDWLDLMIDWPALNGAHPLKWSQLLPGGLPRMHLSMQGQKNYLRPRLVMQFPTALNLTLDPWRIPTNAIHQGITTFAAARGITPWLQQLPWMQQMRLSETPGQYSVWASDKYPFATYISIPERNAESFLKQNGTNIAAALDVHLANGTVPVHARYTNQQILVEGVPMIGPFIRPLHQPDGDYIMGGIFPYSSNPKEPPFPAPLWRELQAKKNLVFYGWEINQLRIPQCLALYQLSLISRGQIPPSPDSAGEKWLMAAKDKLGNCGTEVTLTAPNELTLVRNAPILFTGMELAALAFWVDAPGFPLDATFPLPTRPTMGRPAPPTVKK